MGLFRLSFRPNLGYYLGPNQASSPNYGQNPYPNPNLFLNDSLTLTSLLKTTEITKRFENPICLHSRKQTSPPLYNCCPPPQFEGAIFALARKVFSYRRRSRQRHYNTVLTLCLIIFLQIHILQVFIRTLCLPILDCCWRNVIPNL